MSLIIESEESKRYLQEENAIDGFKVAVNNGQTRLALEILVSIIDTFADIFSAIIEDGEEEAPAPSVIEVEKKVQQSKPVEIEEAKAEEAKKPVAKKPASKEETTTVSE
jgi:hypothetical protein